MRPIWWTCSCGKRQITRREEVSGGRPACQKCGKPAGFTVDKPKGQGGFEFGETDERDGG